MQKGTSNSQYFDRLFVSINQFLREMQDMGVLENYNFEYKLSKDVNNSYNNEALISAQSLIRKYKRAMITMKGMTNGTLQNHRLMFGSSGTQQTLHMHFDTTRNFLNNNPSLVLSDDEDSVIRDPKAPLIVTTTTVTPRIYTEIDLGSSPLKSIEQNPFKALEHSLTPQILSKEQNNESKSYEPTASTSQNPPDFESLLFVDCPPTSYSESGSSGIADVLFCCCRVCHISCLDMCTFADHSCRSNTKEGTNNTDSPMDLLIRSLSELKFLRKYICYVCKIEFRTMYRMRYHLSNCNAGPYKCTQCSQVFSSRRDVNYHKKKAHLGEKCFTCDCGRSFQRSTSLRKHTIRHHEEKFFSDSPDGFSCDSCPKKFVKKIFLTHHKIRMHDMDKKFLCQVCGNKFMSKNSLMTHMKIHEEEKKFDCNICQKKFRTKEKLQHHVMVHTGERPYRCMKCDKGFVSKTRLNEHVSRHEVDRRYPCADCNKTYASAWDLRKHIQKRHNKQVNNVPVIIIPKKSNEEINLNSLKISDGRCANAIQSNSFHPTEAFSSEVLNGPPSTVPFSLHENMQTLNISDGDSCNGPV